MLGPLDLFDRRCVAAEITVREPREAPRQGQVRVERKRPFMQSACLLGALVKKATDMTDQRQRPGVAWVKRDSPLRQLARTHRRVDRILVPRPDRPGTDANRPTTHAPSALPGSIATAAESSSPAAWNPDSFKSVDRGNGAQREVECRCLFRFAGDAALAFAQAAVRDRSGLLSRAAISLWHRQDIVHLPVEVDAPRPRHSPVCRSRRRTMMRIRFPKRCRVLSRR